MVLETARLLLRLPTPEDIDIFREILSSPDQTRFLPGGVPYTPDRQARYLSDRIAHWERHGFGTFIICRKDSRRTRLGYAGVEQSPKPEFIEIRYGLAGRFEKQGYVTEAGQRVLEWIRSDTDISRVYGVVVPENTASTSVLLKLGMIEDDSVNLYGSDELRHFSIQL